ncbi:MAG TPA: hypothetical protein PLU93_05960 [Treponemataceae bacterium]|nr:hypothetical protein [Treponemataceae bacterium]
MRDAKRVLPFVLLHFVLGLAICIGWFFLRPAPSGLIDPFVMPWRLREGILLFVSWMPALHISGMLVGYALSFGKNDDAVSRWSPTLLGFLKGATVLSLVCLALYVGMAEVVAPSFRARQALADVRSQDYAEYFDLAAVKLASDQVAEAEAHALTAVRIWPKSREALALLDRIRYRGAELSAPVGKKGADVPVPPDVLADDRGLTVLGALEKARDAERRLDFFNAHYYATLAARLATARDPNRENALRLAASAWNRIAAGSADLREKGDAELFAIKKKGYAAVQNGDYLTAYYLFLNLSEKQRKPADGKIDPDVERFLDVARRGLLESFFFIDETANAQLAESARDVLFVCPRPDGTADVVFARGIGYTRRSGGEMAYLRSLEVARFSANHELVFRMVAPFAKMFPYIASEGPAGGKPQLLLRAVGRQDSGTEIVPTVIEGVAPARDQRVLVLEMPYADFGLVVAANGGMRAMSLSQLFGFAEKADRYGYQGAAALRELLARLVDPFLILIVSVFALALGWKYRLAAGKRFQAWWVLALPIFPLVSRYAVETVRYLSRLTVSFFVALKPAQAAGLTLGFVALWFVLISVYFVAQRSE